MTSTLLPAPGYAPSSRRFRPFNTFRCRRSPPPKLYHIRRHREGQHTATFCRGVCISSMPARDYYFFSCRIRRYPLRKFEISFAVAASSRRAHGQWLHQDFSLSAPISNTTTDCHASFFSSRELEYPYGHFFSRPALAQSICPRRNFTTRDFDDERVICDIYHTSRAHDDAPISGDTHATMPPYTPRMRATH